MKEKRSFKRFDPVSMLAGVGVLMIVLCEGFFIFELYEADLFQSVWVEQSAGESVAPPAPPKPVENPALGDPAPESPEEIVPVG